MTATKNSTATPEAAIVHLSGRRRGTTEFLSRDHIVIASAADGGVETSTTGSVTLRSRAILDRRGHTFRLSVTPGAELWVNGEQLEEMVLASGDVLEFGDGSVVRFRLYPRSDIATKRWPKPFRIA